MRVRTILLIAAILLVPILLAIAWIIRSIWSIPTPPLAQIELLRFLLQILSVVILGSAASALVAEYNRRRQEAEAHKELNIATATQFQELYGEYKNLWRLWAMYLYKDHPDVTMPDHTRWDLLDRAIDAEGRIESIIIKLAMERNLNKDDIQTLGIFREGFQIVRKSIRDNEPLIQDKEQEENANEIFHEFTIKVANIIASRKRVTNITPDKAQKVLMEIMAVRRRDLFEAIIRYKKE